MQSSAHAHPVPGFDTAAEFARKLASSARKRGSPQPELAVRDGKIALAKAADCQPDARGNTYADLRESLARKLGDMGATDIGAIANRLMRTVVSSNPTTIPVAAARVAALQGLLDIAVQLRRDEGVSLDEALSLVSLSVERSANRQASVASPLDTLSTAARIVRRTNAKADGALAQADAKASAGPAASDDTAGQPRERAIKASPAKLEVSASDRKAAPAHTQAHTWLGMLLVDSTRSFEPMGPVIPGTSPSAGEMRWQETALYAAQLSHEHPARLSNLPLALRSNLFAAGAQAVLANAKGAIQAYLRMMRSFRAADFLPSGSSEAPRWSSFAAKLPRGDTWAAMDRLDRQQELMRMVALHARMFDVKARAIVVDDAMQDRPAAFHPDGYIVLSGHAAQGWNDFDKVRDALVGMLARVHQAHLASLFAASDTGDLDAHDLTLARIFHATGFASEVGVDLSMRVGAPASVNPEDPVALHAQAVAALLSTTERPG